MFFENIECTLHFATILISSDVLSKKKNLFVDFLLFKKYILIISCNVLESCTFMHYFLFFFIDVSFIFLRSLKITVY